MTLRLGLKLIALTAWVLAIGAAPAWAQIYGLPRGFQGLFGNTRGGVSDGQALDVVASVAEGYDTDLFSTPGRLVPDPNGENPDSYYTVFVGNVDYRAPFRRATVRGTLSSELRYFPALRDVQSVAHRGAVGVVANLPRRSTLFLNQSLRYTPSFFNYTLPQTSVDGEVGDVDTTYASVLDRDEQYYYITTAKLTQPVTRRTNLVLRGDYLVSDFINNSATRRDSESHVFGAGYAWSVGRRSSANVAYQYRANEVRDVADPLRSLEHSVDFSFDHRPHITSSRQARLNFKVGLSASDVPVRVSELPPGSVPDAEGPIIQTRQYTMHASAGINYPIGRDWTGYANYERGLAYVGLVEPLNSNTVNAGIEGLLTRRLRFLTSAAYSQGSSLRRTVVYNTYTGTGGLNFAITRGLALYADYQYYFYDFGSSVIEEIDETRPPDLERHSVRVGVAVWVPMLER